jgi:hypothetical protein
VLPRLTRESSHALLVIPGFDSWDNALVGE